MKRESASEPFKGSRIECKGAFCCRDRKQKTTSASRRCSIHAQPGERPPPTVATCLHPRECTSIHLPHPVILHIRMHRQELLRAHCPTCPRLRTLNTSCSPCSSCASAEIGVIESHLARVAGSLLCKPEWRSMLRHRFRARLLVAARKQR